VGDPGVKDLPAIQPERHLDLDRFPLDDLESAGGKALVELCRRRLADLGLFSLEGFVRPSALRRCVAEVKPVLDRAAFTHRRRHTIYFEDDIAGLASDHPALKRVETVNHTVCADQIPDSLVCRLYAWPPLVQFLAATMGKSRLYPMADPLARVNVIAYREGEALNWHFDRSEFTTTLLLQMPEAGGEFQYRSALRSDADPNHDGVARLLAGGDGEVKTLPLSPGTLNVFKGRDTAHRVTPPTGGRERIVAVFSYYETQGVVFSERERIGFYGRTGARG
jgi:alkylated DNA repair dioxygenase AlkB